MYQSESECESECESEWEWEGKSERGVSESEREVSIDYNNSYLLVYERVRERNNKDTLLDTINRIKREYLRRVITR